MPEIGHKGTRISQQISLAVPEIGHKGTRISQQISVAVPEIGHKGTRISQNFGLFRNRATEEVPPPCMCFLLFTCSSCHDLPNPHTLSKLMIRRMAIEEMG